MQGIYGVRNPLLVNDYNYLGVDRYEVPVWHQKLPAIGQLNRERPEAVLEPAFDLIHNYTKN